MFQDMNKSTVVLLKATDERYISLSWLITLSEVAAAYMQWPYFTADSILIRLHSPHSSPSH